MFLHKMMQCCIVYHLKPCWPKSIEKWVRKCNLHIVWRKENKKRTRLVTTWVLLQSHQKIRWHLIWTSMAKTPPCRCKEVVSARRLSVLAERCVVLCVRVALVQWQASHLTSVLHLRWAVKHFQSQLLIWWNLYCQIHSQKPHLY